MPFVLIVTSAPRSKLRRVTSANLVDIITCPSMATTGKITVTNMAYESALFVNWNLLRGTLHFIRQGPKNMRDLRN